MIWQADLVEGTAAIRAFADAPFSIREPRYHAGLSTAEWTADLLAYPFPFTRAHWLVRDGARVVGRIGANLSGRDPARGYVGFYECRLDHPDAQAIHAALLAAAEDWLRSKTARTAFGPVDYSTWFPYRFRTKAEVGTPDFAWEPLQPEAYPERWIRSGYEPLERYSSRSSLDLKPALEATRPYFDRCWQAGFRHRPFRTGADFPAELPLIQSINQRSFQAGFLTEALEPEAYRKFYVPQFAAFDTKHCFFALTPEGKEAGYFFVYGDQGHFVWKTVAVASEFQRLGLGAFGMHHGLTLAIRDGFEHSVAALVKEGAPSEGLTSKPKTYEWAHEYSVFKKAL